MKKILFVIGSLRKQSFNREVSELADIYSARKSNNGDELLKILDA